MFKRLNDRISKDTIDINKLNKYGYVPSQEEMETELNWEDISSLKRKYDF
jgi:hypothetical protein